MNNNAWFKKEMPLQTVIGFGGGATGFGAHSSAVSKLYVDDVFSQYLYRGNESARSFDNGIDLSGKGGLVWIKNRSAEANHALFDTVRGATKEIQPDYSAAETTQSTSLTAFNNNGFSIGADSGNRYNQNSTDYSSWSFRKAKGFCDIVTFTGNGSVRTISHGLGSIPGLIMIKDLSDANSWFTYHRDLGPTKYVMFNHNNAVATQSWFMNDTAPTATEFTVGTGGNVNQSGNEFVAYLFAGGDSSNIDITSKTVTSLGGSFSGSYPMSNINDGVAETSNANNIAYVANSSGNLDVYVDLTSSHVITNYKIAPQGDAGTTNCYNIPTKFEVYGTNDTSSWTLITTCEIGHAGWRAGVYQHFAIPLTSGYRYWRIKVLKNKNNDGTDGGGSSISEWRMDGYSASSESLEYKFGENEDQNLISCGSYTGNGNAAGPEFVLGWEPQWLIIKNTSSAGNGWMMYDAMRGWCNNANDDRYIMANEASAETTFDLGHPTARGFEISTDNSSFNASGDTYIYWTIRRPDGLAGKPPSAATGVFTMDTGNSSGTIPTYDSGFPVDFAFHRQVNASSSWNTSARIISGKKLITNDTAAAATDNNNTFDSNLGWAKNNGADSNFQSWMWKRGQGMDVVTYTGNGNNTDGANSHAHSLGQTPEMIWIHPLSGGAYSGVTHWTCSHKGLNGGTNPWQYTVSLNNDWAEAATSNFGNTAPTSTHFYVGDPGNARSNVNNGLYMAMLFASANNADGDPISKVGSYVGSDSEQTITTGFQPRFVIIKGRDSSFMDWYVLDTLRGWASGVDPYLAINSNSAQGGSSDWGAPISTGFTLTGNNFAWNDSGYNYIYYAHA